ncbi:restriction endonuclease [Streptomyces californicus]|uniref:restriction endonuclease n=1 Tax=Streptomyces californicus TaxID=67351 RepID=UPI003789CD1F
MCDGCTAARQIGGAGDSGADVLATDPLGRCWVLQVKHRKDGDCGSPVGALDFQHVHGTGRQLYGADIVLIVAHGRFSTRYALPRPAAARAPRRPAHPGDLGQRRAPLAGAPPENFSAPQSPVVQSTQR